MSAALVSDVRYERQFSFLGGGNSLRDTASIDAQHINPSSLYSGATYDYASVAPLGGLVFTAGACPLDADGDVVAPGDFEAQTRQTLDNLEAVLNEAGSSLDRILKATVYVVTRERDDLVRVVEVVEGRFGSTRPPNTLLGVGLLGYPEQLVEIEAIAWRSET